MGYGYRNESIHLLKTVVMRHEMKSPIAEYTSDNAGGISAFNHFYIFV